MSDSAIVAVGAAVADYRARVEEVRHDVVEYRQRLMGEARDPLAVAMAKGHRAGLTLKELREAYGTRDHGTVRGLVDRGYEILGVVPDAGEVGKPEPALDAFMFEGMPISASFEEPTSTLSAGDKTWEFEVIEMESGGVMLNTDAPRYPNGVDAEPDPVVSHLDGEVLPCEAMSDLQRFVYIALGEYAGE